MVALGGPLNPLNAYTLFADPLIIPTVGAVDL